MLAHACLLAFPEASDSALPVALFSFTQSSGFGRLFRFSKHVILFMKPEHPGSPIATMNSDELSSSPGRRGNRLPQLPLTRSKWLAISKALGLSAQQTKIVELILRGRCDKQIALQVGLSVPTVRTYLDRVFRRLRVTGRVELVLLIFAKAQREK